MMERLISMTEFVLRENKLQHGNDFFKAAVINYAKFISRPLTLSMFVPTDLDGVPYNGRENTFGYEHLQEQFQSAKQKVMFEGFEYKNWDGRLDDIDATVMNGIHVYWRDSQTKKWRTSKGISTIEDLVRYGLILTAAAKKQIFG